MMRRCWDWRLAIGDWRVGDWRVGGVVESRGDTYIAGDDY